MDYTQVRRRRPIHNKSLPVGPENMERGPGGVDKIAGLISVVWLEEETF
jgi:hypothetical protein